MRPLTQADIRASFVNVPDNELPLIGFPLDVLVADWDYLDFFAWRDPQSSKRGCIVMEIDGRTVAIALRSAEPARSRSGMCNICHAMQPGNQVVMFSARKADASGDSIGTYMCADLTCHDNVRLAHPLAPGEVRAPGQVDLRLDGTRRRMQQFVRGVLAGASDELASTPAETTGGREHE